MMIDFNTLWPKYDVYPYGVLHLGANQGQERETYRKNGVKKVIWVEAIPEVFYQLSENIKSFEGHSALNICVGDVEGEPVEFKVSNNESQSSSYLNLKHHSVIHPEVHYVHSFETIKRRLDKIFPLASFSKEKWLLNLDLQGAELDAIMGMGALIEEFEWIYTEVNKKEVYEGCALISDIDEYLKLFGFFRAETGAWVSDSWTDAFYTKKI